MRAFKIALVPIAALTLSSSAFATAYTWGGGASSAWTTAANWSPSSGYPGDTLNKLNETATIASNSNNPVSLSGSLPGVVATVNINGESANADVELLISGSASATLQTVNIYGGSSSSGTVADDGKLRVTGFSALTINHL